MPKALQQLTVACAQAGFGGAELEPAEEKALATIAQYPAPFPDFSVYLRHLVTG